MLQSFFNQIDLDKSGTLSKDEFTAAVLELKVEISQHDIHLLFDIFDQNKDHAISYNEFLNVMRGSLP